MDILHLTVAVVGGFIPVLLRYLFSLQKSIQTNTSIPEGYTMIQDYTEKGSPMRLEKINPYKEFIGVYTSVPLNRKKEVKPAEVITQPIELNNETPEWAKKLIREIAELKAVKEEEVFKARIKEQAKTFAESKIKYTWRNAY